MHENTVILSFKLPLRVLRAINRLASTDETRYIINGVQVEATPGRLLLVATDGRAMGIYHHGQSFEYAAEIPPSFVIPRTLVERAGRVWCQHQEEQEDDDGSTFMSTIPLPDVTIELRADKSVTIAGPDVNLVGLAVDGNYPDWRKVLPTTPQAPMPGNFNPTYLRVFSDVAEEMHNGCGVTLSLRGYESQANNGPFTIHLPRVPFMGILMPMKLDRVSEGFDAIPAWLSK